MEVQLSRWEGCPVVSQLERAPGWVGLVCAKVLGGCYGTTGPSSLDPKTGHKYAMSFPRYTVRDMVEAQKRLLDRLGVTSLRAVVGTA